MRTPTVLVLAVLALASAQAQVCSDLSGVWSGFFPDPLDDRYFMQPHPAIDGAYDVRQKKMDQLRSSIY